MKRRFFLAGLLAPLLPVPKAATPTAPVYRGTPFRGGYIYCPYIPLFVMSPSVEDIQRRMNEQLEKEIEESIAREIPARINESLYASLTSSDRPLS
jgi:hypothetical protein